VATMLQSEAGRRPRGVLGILGASSLIQWACMLLGAAVLLYLLVLPLEWNQQLFFSVSLIVLAVFINRLSSRYSATLVLAGISVFASSRYIYYRFTNTFGFGAESGPQPKTIDMVFMVILLSAELYAFLILLLGYFQTIRPLGRKPVPLPDNPDSWPTVDIYIPTYNESLSVVRYTVWAAMNLDWPREKCQVYILDDGRREEFRKFASEVGCHYITRADNVHAKAGNINNALPKTHGQYVAIFDCDHVPTRSFLQITMGWFLKDKRLAMVQTPHHFYSPDPFERNLKQFHRIPNEGELFYGLVQDGNDLWNSAFFCGSCAVLRRSALEEIGGIAQETVTEDAHTSLRLQFHGWNTAYLNIPQAAGLATESLSSHVGQRIRWARGMVQILRVDNPLTRPGLKFSQRICYFNAMIHFLYAVPRLIFIVSPLVYLLFGHLNIRGYSLTILAYALPHIVLSTMSNSRIQGKYRYSFWNEVYELVLSPYILFPTLLALVNPKLGKFNVTSKGGLVSKSFFDRRIARPFLFLLGLNVVGLVFAGMRLFRWDSQHPGTVIMNTVWTFYNIVIIGVACAVSLEAEQNRSHVRVAFRGPVMLGLKNGQTLQGDTSDLSNSGAALRVPRGVAIAVGDPVTIRFAFRFIRHDLPATVMGYESGRLRLKFSPLTLAEEEELTRVLYSRADSWLNFSEHRERDRSLQSLGLLVKLAVRGLGDALRGIFSGGSSNTPVVADEMAGVGTTTSASVARSTMLLLVGAVCLHGVPARAAARQTPAPAKHQAAKTTDKAPTPDNSFQRVADFVDLGNPQPVALPGAQARASVRFPLPSGQVVTSATLEVHYRLAPQLTEQTSHLSIFVNGIAAATIPLLHSHDDHTDQEDVVTIPADYLLSDNTMEFVLAGTCAGTCTTPDVVTYVDPSSQLELYGSRLALANDLSLLPAPFLDLTSKTPDVAFAFLGAPDSATLHAAGVVASWFGIISDYHGVKFTATVGSIPEGDVVVVAPASGLPSSLGLAQIAGPTLIECANPSDRFGKLLIVTGNDEAQVFQAAKALSLGRQKLSGDTAKVEPFNEPLARSLNDSPRWVTGDQEASLGDLFNSDLLRLSGYGVRNLFFRLAPDLYFGNRGSVAMHLNFRVDGLPAQQRTELKVYLNTYPVATIVVSDDSAPIQHATVALPISALNTYNNTVTLIWDGAGSPETTPPPALQIMRNSAIDFGGTPHFLDMPKLERFAEAGYPFTRYADLSHSAVVLGDNRGAGLLGSYLDLMGFFGAQTGYPALGIATVAPSEIETVADKDLILLGRYSDSEIVKPVVSSLPVVVGQTSARLADDDNWWMKLRRSAWNPQGRTRQTIEDLLEADPGPIGVIAGFESPFQRGRSVVAILSQDDASADIMGSQISGVVRAGAIYGSISVFYNSRFESLYLIRDTYQSGTLPPYQALNLWFVRRIYLMPLWPLLAACLITVWLLPHIERRARLRLEGKT
jgi:cellulose synthase (UDP-forming)